MVASSNGEVYAPYTRVPLVEEGFHSSEDGSELHSPVYDGSYTPEGAFTALHVHRQLGRRTLRQPDYAAQVRDHHMLQGLHVSSPTLDPELPHSFTNDLSLHDPTMLGFETPAARFHPHALTSTTDYTFGLPQSRLPDPHYHTPHDVLHDPPAGYISHHHQMSMPTSNQASHTAVAHESKSTSPGATTTAGRQARREASNVVIACRQCRARKIRCDSTRPVCHNCTRRNNECEYDAVPKRRGPDKRPGTRQRSCKKRPSDTSTPPAKKKRKTDDESPDPVLGRIKQDPAEVESKAHSLSFGPSSSTSHSSSSPLDIHEHSRSLSDMAYPRDDVSANSRHHPDSLAYTTRSPDTKLLSRNGDVNGGRRHHHDDYSKATFIPLSPSVEYTRKTWWDNLLREHQYRARRMNEILSDLNFLLTSSSYWLSFIHLPTFFRDLQDPAQRVRMQPALIMAALAMATLMKSSEIEHGAEGRSRAVMYRDAAQSLLESACNQQLVDYTLAEAALLLALFENSSHPQYNAERASCSLQFLDRIVGVLSLTFIDRHDADVSVFSSRSAPVVYMPDNYRPPKKCCCVASPQSMPGGVEGYHPYSQIIPPWNPSWSEAEIRKEECRRLCWVALALVANYTLQCSAFHVEPKRFFLSDPANFMLLFPGEAYERALGHEQLYGQSPKDSVWAVYCRSMLLWTSSTRPPDDRWSSEHRTRFIVDILTETRIVQSALDMHQCSVDSTLLDVCREFLYNTQLTATYELRRRLQDVDNAATFDRRQAEEWLYYQDQIAKGVKAAVLQLGEAPGHLLSRRPFQVNWIATQVMICLSLWNYDRSLVHALELAKSFLIPLDVLNVLWPSAVQRVRRDELRQRLEEACVSARLPPPLPAELTLPPILRA
ncbi:uncharacterized protein B0H18DRAFT_871123 [Fomitopsis serialis]|uniref:uncharacterized protein n=1 Tax=Fomitopsis serialis TaxID=139415 RepID=UPI002008BF55|nr:uncharacterized protein B0H18DRAFT_871123 [Neoantrodia serialis]KAH9932503.1 hypothetical protein B0H18DRAFT_871123 [Neoantrodia serialis]